MEKMILKTLQAILLETFSMNRKFFTSLFFFLMNMSFERKKKKFAAYWRFGSCLQLIFCLKEELGATWQKVHVPKPDGVMSILYGL